MVICNEKVKKVDIVCLLVGLSFRFLFFFLLFLEKKGRADTLLFYFSILMRHLLMIPLSSIFRWTEKKKKKVWEIRTMKQGERVFIVVPSIF